MNETPEIALQEIKDLQAVKSGNAQVSLCQYSTPSHRSTVMETEAAFPTWVLPEDHYLIQAAAECYRSVFNKDAEISRWRFSTNGVATCGKYGISSMGFGPGVEKEAHKVNESIPIKDLGQGSLFLTVLPLIFTEYFTKFKDE